MRFFGKKKVEIEENNESTLKEESETEVESFQNEFRIKQEEITKILLAVDEKIAVNRKLLAKQIELKKGLMQDLLSGAKRVKV